MFFHIDRNINWILFSKNDLNLLTLYVNIGRFMFALIQLNNELKIYRRRKRLRKKHRRCATVLSIRHGDTVKYASNIIRFLANENQIKNTGRILKVPSNFCFKTNFVTCVNFIKEVIFNYCKIEGNLKIDFSDCLEVSVTSLVTLKTILEELDNFGTKVASSRYREKKKTIKLYPSNSDIVNRHLTSLNFANFPIKIEEQREYLSLGLMRGHSRNYKENRKAVVSKKVTEFVENTAERFDVGFDETGQNYMEGMVGEILSNAEDHSLRKSEWFVDGVSFLHNEIDNEVIEFNLVIINYGDSMYNGFELTKESNHMIYDKLDKLYSIHKNLFTIGKRFERESLFVLYMLNEGISRIKYLESSRGNGTMNFIRSFIELGRFCNEDPKYKPELNIISGHTVLTCTEEYAPFKDRNHFKLTLNSEKSLNALPDRSMLKYFGGASFPGTILDCKIYLNKRDLDKNIKKQNEII